MAALQEDWKARARELRETGLSEREIADAVGKARSSVHDALQDVEPAAAPVESNGHGDPAAIPGQVDFDGNEAPQPPPESIIVGGTAQLGLFSAGGKSPQSAVLKLSGSKAVLEDGTAFSKGERVALVVHAVIDSVTQRDQTDKQTGIVTSCEQVHVARVVDFYVAEGA